MTLNEYIDAVLATDPDSWIDLGEPAFLETVDATDEGDKVLVRSHYGRHVYRDDIAFSFAHGIKQTERFREPWLDVFPDKVASCTIFDFFHQGAHVFRQTFLHVDGARAVLPVPKPGKTLTTPARKLRMARFLHVATGAAELDFQHALRMSKIEAVDEPWPY